MLTVKEFAEMFHVTKMTVYRWINAGKVKVIRIGSTIRIEKLEAERIAKGE